MDEKGHRLTTLELVLSIVVAFLGGIIIGSLVSPKGRRYIACYNGNNLNNNGNDEKAEINL